MFRRIIITLLSFVLVAPATAFAATPSAGDLVKSASLPDVYYVGADGNRYVFPNEKTYFSWYSTFDVTTLTDAELAALPVGGAATYRPSQLVKLTTDPKVYAVAKGGVLRWVTTETLATELYGADWATLVHDLPDAFFATYSLGDDIATTADYQPTAERDAAPTISVDKGLEEAPPEEPPEEPIGTLALTTSKADVYAGDVITVSVNATHPKGIRKIEIFFDGVLSQSCMSSACTGEIVIPISGTKAEYTVRARAEAIDATAQEKTATLTVMTDASPLASIDVTREFIRSGDLAEIVITADVSIAVLRTDIYVDNASIEACASAIRTCKWSDFLIGDLGVEYEVYGIVKDTLGRTYQTETRTITISDNDSPIVTLAIGKETIFTGETVDVSASASDDDGVGTVEILVNGAVQKTCSGPAVCQSIIGPFENPQTLTIQARGTDSLGMVATSTNAFLTVEAPN